LVPKSNSFAVTNIGDWQIKTIDENYKKKTFCLLGAPNRNSYCIYKVSSQEFLAERHFERGCESDSEILSPAECKEFIVPADKHDIEPIQCSLIEDLSSLRHKRDAAAPNATTFEEADDDNPAPAQDQTDKIKGNPDMMASISRYVKNQVKELLEASDPSKTLPIRTNKKKYPPGQTLLRLCSKVAQKICTPIAEDTFTIVTEAFLTQQTAYQLKDTYISFPAYDRVLAAMTDCAAEAGNIIFVPNTTQSCPSKLPKDISDMIKRNGANKTIPTLPDYALAKPDKFEVVVEVMWKTFLMAHSYCFKFFKQYFNDHHTFTSTLIPFFTNRIQDLWLVGPATDPTAPVVTVNYTSDSIWYGNLLGPAGDLFRNVDYCYRASRIPVGMKTPWSWSYPWFIRRPPKDNTNEWVYRKKRSVQSVDDAVPRKECAINP
jgi:hypothetical protein